MTITKPQLTLSVSCVYYDTDIDVFEATLISIIQAIIFAKTHNVITAYELHIINNNPNKEVDFQTCVNKIQDKDTNLIIHSGHGNIGYGKGNNIAIEKTESTYHLILNPDVITHENALAVGIEYLDNNPSVGLVAPQARNQKNEIEYLAKRTPTLLIIMLRGVNNKYLNKIFRKALDTYAYKDKIPSRDPFQIELASGCFMLCQTSLLKQIGGFSKDYFLYFEDFDLTQRIRQFSSAMYLPSMNICHLGGNAHSKGFDHTKRFLISYFIFKKKKIENHAPQRTHHLQ